MGTNLGDQVSGKFSTRVFAACCLVAVAAVLLTAAVLFVLAPSSAESEARERLEAVCDSLIPGIWGVDGNRAAMDGTVVQDLVTATSRRMELRLTVLQPDGTVVAESHKPPSQMGNHANRPEILEAEKTGKGSSIRRSDSVQESFLYVALRSDHGYVRAAMPVAQLDANAWKWQKKVIWGSVVGLLLAAALAWLLSRRLAEPIRRLASDVAGQSPWTPMHELASGEEGEIDTLSRSIDAMRDDLRAKANQAQNLRDRDLAILASMRDGVIAVNRSQEIVHINRAALALLRIPPGQAAGRLLHEVIRVPGILTAIQGAVDGNEVKSTDFTMHHVDDERIIELQGSTLLEPGGRTIGAVVVLRDVTELRRLESIRRDFVANVSHELKTPLTAIRSLTETLLEEDGPPPELRKRFLEKISTQSARLTTLVTDLLSLSRLEQGDGPEKPEILELGSYVAEAAKFLGAAATAKSIQVSIQIPAAPILVLGEEEGVRQLLNNLLDNAIKYTPQGGKVSIALTGDGKQAVVQVTDTGIGIEAAEIDRIFERFYRVDKARSRELGGTGLGLSIVKHVVISLGGTIEVKSSPGHGTTFTVRIPQAAGGSAESSRRAGAVRPTADPLA